MDALNRARRPLQNQLRKLFDEVENLMVEPMDRDTLNVHFRLMVDAFRALCEVDQKILDQLVIDEATEEQLDAEYDQIRKIKMKFETLRVKMDHCLAVPVTNKEGSESVISGSFDGEGTGLRLPKYEFKKFSGRLLDWLSFWAQFQKIDQHPKLSGSDKFGYLLMSLEVGSEAYEMVSAFPQSNENYYEAVDCLKRRFGNEDLLLQVYIRELLKLVISNVNSKEKLSFPALYTKVDSHLRALKTLNLASADPATWLYPLVESCLPDDILLTWQRSPVTTVEQRTENQAKTRLDLLMDFLGKEVEIRQRMGIVREGFDGSDEKFKHLKRKSHDAEVEPRNSFAKKQRKHEAVPTLVGFQNTDSASVVCVFCQKRNHRSSDCLTAKKLSFEERKKIASANKLCFNCLGKHYARACRSSMRCLICAGKHCNAMCKRLGSLAPTKGNEETKQNNSTAAEKQLPSASNQDIVQFRGNTTRTFSNQVTSSQVSLQTLRVLLKNGNQRMIARVFLDSGSQRSYILQSTAQYLGLPAKGIEIVAHELFGGTITGNTSHKKYEVLLSRLDGNFECKVEVREQGKISESIPTASINDECMLRELRQKGIILSDVGEGTTSIDILLGADHYGLLLTGNIEVLENGRVAIETKLGWTIIGGGYATERKVMSMSVTDYSISQLWDLDTIGVLDSTAVKTREHEELEAKLNFMKNITRDDTGRYIVKLPWIAGHPYLPDNMNIAMKRLERTTKNLKQTGMFEIYSKLFQDWEKEGFIEEVKDTLVGDKIHYIPHRAVIKPSSLTTPVRPVFDASCKVGKSPSLNECLHKGTNFIQSLSDILLRFREKQIGFTADIRKAFQMIEVDAKDRDAMRFLWWNNDNDIKIYRHKRVMFGATCSPFILGAVLDYHLTHLKEHQDIGKKLLQSMYVDNSVGSEETVEEYQRFRSISTKLLLDCQMDLRMWLSNVDEFDDPTTHVVSILGVQWERELDELFLKTDTIQVPEKITKRTVLSTAHKVFDPIGHTCPAIIPLKCLLQRAWISKIKWDEPLPLPEQQEFVNIVGEMHLLEKIKIPRWMSSPIFKYPQANWSLHTFTDASTSAYSCATYIRIVEEENIIVRLLAAKARVAPVKKVTIPRLELLGCLIGARQGAAIKSALSMDGIPDFYWTDSTTALAWIQRDDGWGTFVGNRTSEINKLTKRENWRHVPGSMNPADLPSRGCSPSQLLQSNWWLGPSWLCDTEFTFDITEIANEEEVEQERCKSSLRNEKWISMTVLLSKQKELSFTSMVRIIGWVRRFIHNCRSATKTVGILSNMEIFEAEEALVYTIQQEAFGGSSEARFKGLDVFRNNRGLLFVKTRIIRRDDLVDSNTPLVLPGKHPVVQQLIWDYHRAYCHAGVGFLMMKLRKKYWILKARKSIKFVLSKCLRCRRLTAKPAITEAAPLPLDRIKDANVYETVGVDLAGPLILRNGKKVWLVIITCAVYRAVYLDVVDSLSTKTFIKCLERFIEKHGRPAIIYSDNGTNFRGCDNLFRSLDWGAIQQNDTTQPIIWKFNPPSGPWWGGFWERLIRTVKDLLRKSVGKASLTRKELTETLKVVQEVMNGRPLTYVTENTDDLEPLTPSMFLKPCGIYRFPEGSLSEGERLRIRYKYMQTLWRELKQRFQKEYLSMLVSNTRKKPTRSLKEGELVVVACEQKKRLAWPLGRILQLIPGKDGVARVARVKMADGELVRPVQRLHPLELDADSNIGHHMQTRLKSKSIH